MEIRPCARKNRNRNRVFRASYFGNSNGFSFFVNSYSAFFFSSPKLISIIFRFLIECAKHICVVYKSSYSQFLPATEKKKRISGNTQIVSVIPVFFQQETFKKKQKQITFPTCIAHGGIVEQILHFLQYLKNGIKNVKMLKNLAY